MSNNSEKFIMLNEALNEIKAQIKDNDNYNTGCQIAIKYFSIFHDNKLSTLLPSKMKEYLTIDLKKFVSMKNSEKLLLLSSVKNNSFETYFTKLVQYGEAIKLDTISIITLFILHKSEYITTDNDIMSKEPFDYNIENWKIFCKYLDDIYGTRNSNNVNKMLNVTKGSYNIFLDKSVLTTNVSVMSERISSPTVQKSSLSTSTPLSSSTPLSTTQLGNKSSIYDLSDVYIEDVLKINNDSTGNKSSKTSIVTQDKKNLSLDNTSEKLMKSGLTLNHNDGNILSSHFKFNNLNIGKIIEKIQYNNLIKKKFDGTFFLDFLDFSNKYGYLYHVYALFNDPIVKQEIKRLTKATTLDTAKLLSIDSILNTSSVHSLKKIAIFHKDELFQDKIGSNYKSSNTTENSTYKNLKDKLHEMSISIVLIDKNVNIDELEMVLKISKNLKQESFVGLQESISYI